MMRRGVVAIAVAAVGVAGCGSAESVARSCDASYPDVCVWAVDGDLDCSHLTSSSFRVVRDPHGLDSNHDGYGCSRGDAKD